MKRTMLSIVFLMLVSLPALGEEGRLLRQPDIHGDRVVFVYAGDIWIAPTEGGVARRLTSHPGLEQFPKFSPDGQWIAFTGEYDGNDDVYLIPSVGGEPKRLTYHPYNDLVVDWYPDGKAILFRSSRNSFSGRFNRYHRISLEGGFPEVLPLPTGELGCFNADAGKIAYNRLSREFRTWKRYHGGTAQDVWIYDFAANTIERITDYDGTDAFPMWAGDKIYFISDRNNTMNLYSYELNTRETSTITDYSDYDVKWPSLGPGAIVYENAGWLYALDLASGRSRRLSIEIFDDKIWARPAIKNVRDYIHNAGISPSGARAALEARGEIFTVPADKGEIRNLTNTSGIREMHPAWSPDGKWVAYFSDRSGEFDLYIRDAAGKGGEVRITSDSDCYRAYPVWSPDSKKIFFSDAMVRLYYVDIEAKKTVQVDHGLHARSTNFIFGSWSPDSRWIAYAKPDENNLYSIFLFSLDEGKSYRVTGNMYHDTEPVFDPEGKYLFFIANRMINNKWSAFEPMMIYDNPARIVGLCLQKGTPSPVKPESDEEAVKGEAEGGGKAESGAPVKIDLDGLGDRIFTVPAPDGYYIRLSAAKGKVFFHSVSDTDTHPDAFPDDPRIGPLMGYDFNSRQLFTVLERADEYRLAAGGGRILYRSGDDWGIADAAAGQKPGTGKLDLSDMTMLVDYKAEWRQIFYEVWRRYRDWFYDPNMHGVDWEGMKGRYEVLLPYVAHRDDLNYVIGELIAELSCSHTYRGGGDYPETQRVGVGLLACDFQPDTEAGYYRFAKIYAGENWDPRRQGPLSQPGLRVKEGDFLIAVDGTELRYPTNPWALFQDTARKTVVLKINSEPKAEGAWEIEVTTVGNDSIYRYLDWVAGNRKKVWEATGGRVGYIHAPSTSMNSFVEFSRTFYAQANAVEGLIIDGRYNSGGYIPEIFIERLDRPLLGRWATRATDGWKTPSRSFQGPMAYLINPYAGSGGDAFPFFFRERGLGPLIGTRTWGGLVGISGDPPLMDNGFITTSDFGFVNPDGEWDVEGKGVAPDIEVDDRPDLVIAGHDPTLEKAVEYIMRELEERGPAKPKFPKEYPKR